jgi:hypothetical protein
MSRKKCRDIYGLINKAVSHADAQMDAQSRRWHQPAIESGICNYALPIEQAGLCHGRESSLARRHFQPYGELARRAVGDVILEKSRPAGD